MTSKPRPKPWRQTPLIESQPLSNAAGCRILLKLEHLQPGGSFKSRGIGNFMALRDDNPTQAVHFYSSSGGNAGIACVTAAVALGRPATVVVPLSTSQLMIDKIRVAGAAEVVQRGATWRDADGFLQDDLIPRASAGGARERAVYVPPFEDPDIWAGHASMIEEIAAQLEGAGERAPDVVACSVGGGGLFNGLMQGVEVEERSGGDRGWDRTVVLAVETVGADSLGQSLEAGELVTLGGITSLATTLGAVRVSPRTFELASAGVKSGRVRYASYSDAEAAMGVWEFAELERIMVELSCGVTMAVCFGGRLAKALGRPVKPDDIVVLVVCGGHYTTTELIERWKGMFKDSESLKSGT